MHPLRSPKPRLESLEDRAVPATLYVDDDLVQKPSAKYTSINLAIQAAKPGDKIVVSPGLYEGGVFANKKITLVGPNAGDQPEDRGGDTPNPKKDAIVFPADGGIPAVTIAANDVTVDGFTIRGSGDAPGIWIDAGYSGFKIVNNILRDNAYGIDLAASGAKKSRIEGNYFLNNNALGDNDLNLILGYGIYSSRGAHNVVIGDNYFTGHQSASIRVASEVNTHAPNSKLTIEDNELVKELGRGIILRNVTDSAINENEITRPGDDGIFLGGSVTKVKITNNVLRDGLGSAIDMREGGEFGFGNNENNRIEGNKISGFADHGILMRVGTRFTTVRNNTVEDNGLNGIYVSELADRNLIEKNKSRDNGGAGILVDEFASLNTFKKNELEDNGTFDAHDDSDGAGTAGTANTWKDNEGDTENRPGLLDD